MRAFLLYHFHTFGALTYTNSVRGINLRFVVGFETLHLQKPMRHALTGRMHQVQIMDIYKGGVPEPTHNLKLATCVIVVHLKPPTSSIMVHNKCFRFIVGV